MTRKILIAASALALIAGAPNLAIAKSIKDMISHDSLVQYCTTNGIGEYNVSVTLPSGETVTGTLHCEAEDLAGAADDDSSSASSAPEGEDDASEVEDGSDDSGDGSDNHGEASGGDDDNGDDNSGSGGEDD